MSYQRRQDVHVFQDYRSVRSTLLTLPPLPPLTVSLSLSLSLSLVASESDFFSKLIVSAVQRVKTTNSKGDTKYPIKSINILKCKLRHLQQLRAFSLSCPHRRPAHGRSAKESFFVDGYALNCTIASQGESVIIERLQLLSPNDINHISDAEEDGER